MKVEQRMNRSIPDEVSTINAQNDRRKNYEKWLRRNAPE